jgi:hypothetical protein
VSSGSATSRALGTLWDDNGQRPLSWRAVVSERRGEYPVAGAGDVGLYRLSHAIGHLLRVLLSRHIFGPEDTRTSSHVKYRFVIDLASLGH